MESHGNSSCSSCPSSPEHLPASATTGRGSTADGWRVTRYRKASANEVAAGSAEKRSRDVKRSEARTHSASWVQQRVSSSSRLLGVADQAWKLRCLASNVIETACLELNRDSRLPVRFVVDVRRNLDVDGDTTQSIVGRGEDEWPVALAPPPALPWPPAPVSRERTEELADRPDGVADRVEVDIGARSQPTRCEGDAPIQRLWLLVTGNRERPAATG